MLSSISSYVKRCVGVMSRITGIDVEVVDSRLERIAATGIYENAVGQNIANAGQVYRHVLKTGEPLFLYNPKSHQVCHECPSRKDCPEKLNISVPIKAADEVVGVLGLVCFTEKDKENVLNNIENYTYFIEQIAALISSRLKERLKTDKAKKSSRVMTQIMELNDRGIIVFNYLGEPSYFNKRALHDLSIDSDNLPINFQVRTTGEKLSEFDEFMITCDGVNHLAIGQRHIMEESTPEFSSVLVFNSLKKFTDHITSLTSENNGPGIGVIIGQSDKMKRLKSQIKKIALSTSTVLITGESGTGKEIVARAIHQESDRKDKPFVAINCGAIPDTLLESELFGYTRGAFSGASPKGRIGKFELANNGIIFLDEIGTLPLYLQVKLLRVLQERQICRLGSNTNIDINVRIIAATNANLVESIKQNTFREDLYYRLNVIPLELPPLRERLEDLEILANHFLAKYGTLFNKTVGLANSSIITMLNSYHFPGNVRELENAIEFAVNMMPENSYLSLEHLPPKIINALKNPTSVPNSADNQDIRPLDEIEKEAISKALKVFASDQNAKGKAAKALGIGVATLYRKIKEYGL